LCVSFGCETDSPAETTRKEAEKEEKRLEAKRLDDFYEMEWIQCVNEMGLDRCRAIQETGFVQCYHQRTTNRNGGSSNECIEDRFKDRLKTLPVETEKSSEQLAEAPTP
jgi:hypothetical protein